MIRMKSTPAFMPIRILFIYALLTALLLPCVFAQKITGLISAEGRVYGDEPILPGQEEVKNNPTLPGKAILYPAATLEPKFSYKWETAKVDLNLQPYFRYDRYDSNRTLLDFKSAKLGYGIGSWYFKVGYDVEFWGVLEFQNLVDILNQTDLPYDFLSKRKLGQPMASASWVSDWGTVDAYALLFFQPKSFPGRAGRSRPPYPILEAAIYESELESRQPEFAFRYSRTVGDLDFALSHFFGTSREPEVIPIFNPARGVLLSMYYPLLQQTGLEMHWTSGNLLVKSETVLRLRKNFSWSSAAIGLGLEYNVGSRMAKAWDLSLIGEYLYDRKSETLLTPFTRDLFAGFRLGCNDSRSTEVTLGLDWDHGRGRSEVILGEASTRLSDRLKLLLSGRYLTSLEMASPFYPLRNDSYTKLGLELYL
jgi:hypothetical protein